MELNRIYLDSDFKNTVVPVGQRFLFLGYHDGIEGSEIVIRYKDSDGNFGNIASGSINEEPKEQYIEVNSLSNGFIVVNSGSIPIFIKTSLGNFYPIEKDTLFQNDEEFYIDATPYLAYDNTTEFSGSWRVYLSGGIKGDSLRYDEVGQFSDRSKYDDKPYKFSFLAVDERKIYIKLSNNRGDWSQGISVDGKDGVDYVYDHTAFEVHPTVEDIASGTKITVNGNEYSYRFTVAKGNIEKFILRTTTHYSQSDVTIDWGDGNVTKISDGFNNSDFVYYHEDGDECDYMLSHVYNVEDNSKKFIIRIFGKKYFGIKYTLHNVIMTENGIFTDNQGNEYLINLNNSTDSNGNQLGNISLLKYNLISRVFEEDLPISSCLQNLSSFCISCEMESNKTYSKMFYVKVPYNYFNHYIFNISYIFEYNYNLKFVSGFNSSFLEHATAIRSFYNCQQMTDLEYYLPIDATFNNIFNRCLNLTINISNLFNKKYFQKINLNVDYAFYNCKKLTGTVPAKLLWNDKNIDFENTTNCFKNCSDNIVAQVPISWGGTADNSIVEKSDKERIEELELIIKQLM